MTDLHDDQSAAPEAVFSPDEPLESLWVKSYQGEVLGEILFGRIATQRDDPDQRHKMEVLATLERRTKEAIAPTLVRAGISTEPDPETTSVAESLADGSASLSWDDLIGSLEPITAQYIALYVRIGELDASEKAASDLLVGHEEAIRDFGRLEMSGDLGGSLKPIEALPHMR